MLGRMVISPGRRQFSSLTARRLRGVALDMDGTTLNSQHALSPRTIQAIRRVDAVGLQVVIATGRPALALQRYITELALPKPVPCICFNGACSLLMEPQRRGSAKVVSSETLLHSTATKVLQLCEEMGRCPSYTLADRSLACPTTEGHESQLRRFEALEGLPQERVTSFDALLAAGELPLKVVAFSDQPEADAILARAALPAGVVQIIPAEMHVEFLSPDMSKGRSLVRFLSEHLGLRPEEVAAFGDNSNDREMLQLVGEGVAMLNAKETLKKVAKRVCQWSNDEDGVARELEQLIEKHLSVPARATL